jgi:hypothetical protein
MDGNMKVQNFDNRPFALGDNEFESGLLSIPANAAVKRGALLLRAEGGNFTPMTGTGDEEPVAVYPHDEDAGSTAATSVSIRAMVAGKANAAFLNVAGDPCTEAQLDMIRKYGIIPVKTKDLSVKDNQ